MNLFFFHADIVMATSWLHWGQLGLKWHLVVPGLAICVDFVWCCRSNVFPSPVLQRVLLFCFVFTCTVYFHHFVLFNCHVLVIKILVDVFLFTVFSGWQPKVFFIGRTCLVAGCSCTPPTPDFHPVLFYHRLSLRLASAPEFHQLIFKQFKKAKIFFSFFP